MGIVVSINENIEPGLLQRDIVPAIGLLLNKAKESYRDKSTSENLLKQAFATDPSVLDTYVVYYKFYFYHRMLDDAEKWVNLALEISASQGGFDKDWHNLNETSAFWDLLDGPERVYLYSLKALSFLRMKQGDFFTSSEVLDCLKELDPHDQVGWSVVSQLLSRMYDDEN